MAPGTQFFSLLAGIVVDSAQGSTITDVDGNVFLDIIGGIGVNGLGHSHPKLVAALQEQLAKISVGSFTSVARVEFFERFEKYHPIQGQYRTQLYSSGAEAVESALRLAKSFTKRTEFISFWGGFHGKTMGALSLMGSEFKKGLGPMVSGSHLVPYPVGPGCPWQETSVEQTIAFLKDYIRYATTGDLAAIIVEPMQGTAGNWIPPAEFLSALKKVTQEQGALLIADEMITGFGRTGKFWGHEHSNIQPDIITLGKQFGGGYPVSAVCARTEVAQASPWSHASGSSSSYGGNPLASTAISTSLRIIEEENLVENSRAMGSYFLEKLQSFERFGFVGAVRGKGLFLGIDLVQDKKSRQPLAKEWTHKLFGHCLKRGLLTMSYASAFRIQPAMTIDKPTIDTVVSILEESFEELEKELP